ncbi:hypothetical protein EVAR_12739_1 [Eumeta japonica]|uniref:Uncharacterized protein n=1 Tax=Eumeta variegata TaxID=151549 RepID=A0A4C1UMM3_EUMVA|nr:hypothetical protein EVAR_12739_1 [Eumeta japonica]
MIFERGEGTIECDIYIEDERIKQVEEFVYLGYLFINDGIHNTNMERRVNAGNKLNGTLLAIMNSKIISRQAHFNIHSGVLIPKLMYGCENWVWQKKNKSGIKTMEMRSLRSTYGVSQKVKYTRTEMSESDVI